MNVAIVLGIFLLGFIIGRVTASKEKTTTVYRPVVPRGDALTSGRDIAQIDPEVEAAIRSGHKIDAIRRYREIHGTDLKDAKDAVDAIEATLKP
jgi:ribosomal protein L7/L12